VISQLQATIHNNQTKDLFFLFLAAHKWLRFFLKMAQLQHSEEWFPIKNKQTKGMK
jgi:hypothetical protein